MSSAIWTTCRHDLSPVSRDRERTNARNGYRIRDWDTRVGSIDLAIPRLRQGSYFPDWLLRPRRRAERALVAVIAEVYLTGVSTRCVEGLVQTLGADRMSKSQVSDVNPRTRWEK